MVSCLSPAHRALARQRGLSLIEIMVSLAIGLVVVGAVFTNYLNTAAGSRYAKAQTEVTGNAALALGILRNHLAMAGYVAPTNITTAGLQGTMKGPSLVACDNGFSGDTSTDATAIVDGSNPAALSCVAVSPDTTPTPSIMVRYEVDAQSGIQVTDGTTHVSAPADCSGAAITATGGVYIAENRFKITAPHDGLPVALSCMGNGGNANVGLVENISAMHLTYGIGNVDATTGKLLYIERYADAAGVSTLNGTAANAEAWSKVLAVRICVVAQSTDEVLPAATPYRGCDNDVVTPSDRRLYRAFTSTVMLNNRLNTASLPGEHT
jgi:type IV pilus assembly protein PilW